MQLFPIENYDQTLTHFIHPSDADYNQTLLSPEVAQMRFQDFFCRYFDSSTTGLSPWSKTHVATILNATAQDNIFNIEAALLKYFSNADKKPEEIGYGINFRPYTATWIKALADNIEITQFKAPIPFNPKHCGITVDNLDARALPTLDPHFYNPQIAGQGYPFDNLQLSSVWAGTPVYIIGTTINGEWHLVLTPNVLAWVKSTGIAYTDSQFITTWQKQAKQKLAAIIQTKTPIIDSRGIFRFNAYIGSIFPIQQEHTQHYTLMIPSVDEYQNAVINTAQVTKDQLAFMPLSFTPRHFAIVISSLIGRPYGWGGMYFYNDCSQELKSIYTPFGIWLPQHSSEQVSAGMIFDLNKLPMSKRIDTLTGVSHFGLKG